MLGSNDIKVRNNLQYQETQFSGEDKSKQMIAIQYYIHRLLNKYDRERLLHLLFIKLSNFPAKLFLNPFS